MYRFALRPRWIVGHVLVLTLVAVLAILGVWQLRRLEERRDVNAVVEQRSHPTTALPAEGWNGARPSTLEFRRVQVEGRYDADAEVLLRFRPRAGMPGHHVLTPLVTDRGTVMVDRGWVPLAVAERWPAPGTVPPAGPVRITGILRSSQEGPFRPQRPRPGSPLTVGAVDLAGLSRALSRPLYPLYLQLDPQAADAAASYPVPVDPPPLDEGPHLSYALQWFTFAAGAAVGWVILVRQSARGPAITTAPGEGSTDGVPAALAPSRANAAPASRDNETAGSASGSP